VMTPTNFTIAYHASTSPRKIYEFRMNPRHQRISTLIDILSWAIATNRLQLIAHSWRVLESEVRDG